MSGRGKGARRRGAHTHDSNRAKPHTTQRSKETSHLRTRAPPFARRPPRNLPTSSLPDRRSVPAARPRARFEPPLWTPCEDLELAGWDHLPPITTPRASQRPDRRSRFSVACRCPALLPSVKSPTAPRQSLSGLARYLSGAWMLHNIGIPDGRIHFRAVHHPGLEESPGWWNYRRTHQSQRSAANTP